jgi:hypothetical protein
VDPSDDDIASPPSSDAPAPFTPPPTRRALKALTGELFAPKPRPSAPRSGSTTTKEVVNGLDRREITIAVALTVLNLYLLLTWAHHLHTSTVKADRDEVSTFLELGVTTMVLVVLGTAFRRRALLGFACFLAGLFFLNYHLGVEFVFNVAFGGWLILRAQRAQRQQRGAATKSPGRGSPSGATARRPPAAPKPPTASKRYTPPKRTRTSGRR